MKLLMSPTSPYVRKLRVLIRETDLDVEEVAVNTTPLATAAELAAANPLGRIPALVRADGPTLFDSRVIARFLDDLAGSGLYPEARIWDVLTLEALGDGINDSAVSMAYEAKLRNPAQQSPDWIAAQWNKVDRALGALETQWMPLLQGPLNMGQITVAAALGYLDLRHSDRGWRDSHASLAAWFDEFSKRQSMVDTQPA